MKDAKVREVRDVRASVKHDPAYTEVSRRLRIEELLRDYPDISEAQTEEIVTFLARGMHLDVGLVAANEQFKEKIATLRREHAEAFRLKPLEGIIFVIVVLTPLILLSLLPYILGRS